MTSQSSPSKSAAAKQLSKLDLEIAQRVDWLAEQETQIDVAVVAWGDSMREMQARSNELQDNNERLIKLNLELERKYLALETLYIEKSAEYTARLRELRQDIQGILTT